MTIPEMRCITQYIFEDCTLLGLFLYYILNLNKTLRYSSEISKVGIHFLDLAKIQE